MTKFQIGLLVGFFLGALSLFVVLGIIRLYIEERQDKYGAAGRQAAQEKKPEPAGIPLAADHTHSDQPSSSTN